MCPWLTTFPHFDRIPFFAAHKSAHIIPCICHKSRQKGSIPLHSWFVRVWMPFNRKMTKYLNATLILHHCFLVFSDELRWNPVLGYTPSIVPNHLSSYHHVRSLPSLTFLSLYVVTVHSTIEVLLRTTIGHQEALRSPNSAHHITRCLPVFPYWLTVKLSLENRNRSDDTIHSNYRLVVMVCGHEK